MSGPSRGSARSLSDKIVRKQKAGNLPMRFVHMLGLAVFAAGLTVSQSAVFAESAEKGKAAYMQHGCWQCHGTVGQGGVAGPKLAPDPIAVERFMQFVRTTGRAMPPYMEAVLSNGDLADIHAYLASIPKGPDGKDIPLLNQ
jgi:mono/diheme cytochrome c family protein